MAGHDPVKAKLVDDFFLDMYVYCGGLLPDKCLAFSVARCFCSVTGKG